MDHTYINYLPFHSNILTRPKKLRDLKKTDEDRYTETDIYDRAGEQQEGLTVYVEARTQENVSAKLYIGAVMIMVKNADEGKAGARRSTGRFRAGTRARDTGNQEVAQS